MADWHGSGRSRNSINDGDFDEEEVWSYEKEDSSSPTSSKPREPSSSSSSAWRLPSAPRTIRRGSNSSSAARHETEVTRQSSAPLNIPDWSKIYGKHANMEPSRNESWVNTGDDDGDDDDDGMVYEDGDMVPPHEWLARKLARTRVSSFSVCEGMGRTLKGRDLSKVRNAVLTRTGFLEQ
ncbi:hypothetical protein ERO13_D09G068900v2 [Gossypium hirsutum]|uniref:Senescence regulator S40 n=6 Tax=Gossypium TaxID=3633 RepID=A0ABM3AN67_GOSHI|nr:uncharacterized protein LOC107891816 [Gossypium hirsutum]KAB2012286.1 hypothetical protein ES319_D09G078900v1 [Gossypium barbadense]TYG53223.1 hypothetical protein ES288_D09G092300v1 [Gossypium darwinii]TYH53251.1 hypothetical protein ES332_D09G086200v1 [Gossypium tomentosum]TYI64376.1 hypothetical protein E1A91_D09G084100v1 [Gossypium mustelinum]KAG4129266.1 hypothetical protein ERO13_D09G068900v2 [Gossypium hirsutum]